jgi:hypothetical protein
VLDVASGKPLGHQILADAVNVENCIPHVQGGNVETGTTEAVFVDDLLLVNDQRCLRALSAQADYKALAELTIPLLRPATPPGGGERPTSWPDESSWNVAASVGAGSAGKVQICYAGQSLYMAITVPGSATAKPGGSMQPRRGGSPWADGEMIEFYLGFPSTVMREYGVVGCYVGRDDRGAAVVGLADCERTLPEGLHWNVRYDVAGGSTIYELQAPLRYFTRHAIVSITAWPAGLSPGTKPLFTWRAITANFEGSSTPVPKPPRRGGRRPYSN